MWGETVLESLPKWPWVGRDPKFREHTRFQSGDPDAAFVRAELGEVELHDEIFATRKGSRFVLEGENDLLVKGSAIPAHSQEMRDEYVRHDSWVLSLQKGTVARQVRSRPEITRLAPGQKRLLNESAKAYPKAVPLITNAKQANLIAEAVERFAAIKFLHIESDYWAEGWIGDWVSRPPVPGLKFDDFLAAASDDRRPVSSSRSRLFGRTRLQLNRGWSSRFVTFWTAAWSSLLRSGTAWRRFE